MSEQRRHESPELGDAIVRMMRGLVTRASEGDTEAIEQLARIELLAPTATALGAKLSRHSARFGYSYTQLGDVLGVSRQAARQRVERLTQLDGDAHQLMPGHRKSTCPTCVEQLRETAVAR